MTDGSIATYEGLPDIDDCLLAELTPLTEAELGVRVDDLLQIVAEQPDDVMALSGLRQAVKVALDRGYIDTAFQVAMTVGAMACMHDHSAQAETSGLKDAASQMERNLFGDKLDLKSDDHDKSKCASCKAGRPCSKRHK